MEQDQKTLWCGNLSENVSEELLYELFLQAAPIQKIKIPKDKDGRQLNYAFITLKHDISVPYVIKLLNGIPLYERKLNLKPRNANVKAETSFPPFNNHQHFTITGVNNLGLQSSVGSNNFSHNNYGKANTLAANCTTGRNAYRNEIYRREDTKPYKHFNHNDYNNLRYTGRQGHHFNSNNNVHNRNRKYKY